MVFEEKTCAGAVSANCCRIVTMTLHTEQSVKRSRTEPREEDYEYRKWKNYQREAKTDSWKCGHWDIPYVREQDAVQHAASMADRWQRMYFRAIRNLREWRRYTPQVTINNPNQVNIATDGGQQVNVSVKEEEKLKSLTS